MEVPSSDGLGVAFGGTAAGFLTKLHRVNTLLALTLIDTGRERMTQRRTRKLRQDELASAKAWLDQRA